MQENMINNMELKKNMANSAVYILVQQNLLNENDFPNLQAEFGYIFKENEKIEALYKIMWNGNVEYFAVQNGKLMNINIDEKTYIETIDYMNKKYIDVNTIEKIETVSQKNRRMKNNELLKRMNIVYSDNLSCFTENRKMKSIDDLCKRAIACLLVIQVACDINYGRDYEKAVRIINLLLEKFGVKDCLNSKEKRIIEGNYTKQDCYDMDWAYEAYWALCWVLGLVDDITISEEICDCNKAIDLVINSGSYDNFKSMCKLRSIDEVLDMEDLYFRYHWAINENILNNNANIGNLDKSNVIERRRGLTWVLSDTEDWYDLDLNA